jgi:hypothetical protein
MSSSNLIRTGGGLASAAAGLLLALGHLLDLGGDLEYGTVLGGALVLTAHVVLIFALVALYAAQAQQSGLLGSLGMVLSVVGTTLVSGVVLVEIAGASGGVHGRGRRSSSSSMSCTPGARSSEKTSFPRTARRGMPRRKPKRLARCPAQDLSASSRAASPSS